MKMQNKKNTTVAKILLVLGLVPQTAKPGMATLARAGVVVGAIALTLASTAYAVDWFSSVNDDKLITLIPAEIRRLDAKYGSHIKSLRKAFNLNRQIDSYDKSRVLNTTDENFLYSVACKIWDTSDFQSSYRFNLKKDFDELSGSHARLTDRIYTLENARSLDHHQIKCLQSMRKIAKDLEYVLPELDLLERYLDEHEAYFAWAEQEWVLYRDYKEELDCVTNHAQGSYFVADTINRIVRSKYGTYPYPYIKYVQMLENSFSTLHKCKKAAAYSYPDRIAWTNTLSQKLEQVRAVVDPEYSAQMYARELV